MLRSPRRSRWARRLLVAACALLCAAPATAATARLIQGNCDFPVALRFAPDGRLFYCELTTGRVMTLRSAYDPDREVWATLPVLPDGERGLLGMAFHPQFPDSPWVYFFHTHPDPLENRVVRLRDLDGRGVDPQVLFRLPAGSPIHHGGRLAFGGDGLLYVTYGDQNVAAAARAVGDVRGKLLRLTPVGAPAGGLFHPADPAYARGIRNAFGLCFDPANPRRAFFTENGPECDDELNQLWGGADYGWGPTDACDVDGSGSQAALARFSPTIAPTGCVVYRGGPDPDWEGALFFGTFNMGDLRRATFDPLTGAFETIDVVATTGDAILDVTQGPDGRLWLATFDAIYRVSSQPLAAPPPAVEAPLTAWPNPSSREVSFRLARPGDRVALEVFDARGRRIRSLPAFDGLARWDGRDERGAMVPAGIYLARLTAGAGVHTTRIVRLGD